MFLTDRTKNCCYSFFPLLTSFSVGFTVNDFASKWKEQKVAEVQTFIYLLVYHFNFKPTYSITNLDGLQNAGLNAD